MLWSLIQKWDCTAMTRAVERDYVEVVEMIQRVTGEEPPEKWCAFRRYRGAARGSAAVCVGCCAKWITHYKKGNVLSFGLLNHLCTATFYEFTVRCNDRLSEEFA